MTSIIIKATGIWLIIVIAAILNGLVREQVLSPIIGSEMSLPLSGIILSLLIFLIAYFLIPFIDNNNGQVFLLIGLYWVVLTLSFEYLFGHFVLKMPWADINKVFNIKKGNLFIVAVFASALAPWLVAKIKGILRVK